MLKAMLVTTATLAARTPAPPLPDRASQKVLNCFQELTVVHRWLDGIATSSVRSSSTEVVGDYCSESRRQLIRRFAAAACFAEQLEARLVNGEQIDIQQHATLSSTLVAMSDAWNVPDAGDLARVGRLALVVEFLIQREGRKFETDRELPLNYSAFPVSRAISPSKILRIYRILSEAR